MSVSHIPAVVSDDSDRARPPASWQTLPMEIMLAVMDDLGLDDLRSLARADSASYRLALPRTFQSVRLASATALHHFVSRVPESYLHLIRELHVCTVAQPGPSFPLHGYTPSPCLSAHPRTNDLAHLLAGCTHLAQLSLKLAGSLDKSIVPVFAGLHQLTRLAIANWGIEEDMPISERLVVAIAATAPSLTDLRLSRISRSLLHAPELANAYPYIPLVTGDENVAPHPLLGSNLHLPALLRLPHLRHLAIYDTHLGDPGWARADVSCRLESLELGACAHEGEDYNARCAMRILRTVGSSLASLTLGIVLPAPAPRSGASLETDADGPPPVLPALRSLVLSASASLCAPDLLDGIPATCAALTAGGARPAHLSVRCHADDLPDACEVLVPLVVPARFPSSSPSSYSGATFTSSNVTDSTISTAPLLPSVTHISLHAALPAGPGTFSPYTTPAERARAAAHLRSACAAASVGCTVEAAAVAAQGAGVEDTFGFWFGEGEQGREQVDVEQEQEFEAGCGKCC